MINIKGMTDSTLAPIATASFCVAKRNKRYSGKRDQAPKKIKQNNIKYNRQLANKLIRFLKKNHASQYSLSQMGTSMAEITAFDFSSFSSPDVVIAFALQ